MLIHLLDFIRDHVSNQGDLGPLRVLTYHTVRAGLALAISFLLSLILGPGLIERLRAMKFGQVIRTAKRSGSLSLSEMHGGKAGTPTMGGLIMLIATVVPVLLLCRLSNTYILMLLAVAFGYAALGFYDDWLKIAKKHHGGLSPRGKLLLQAGLGALLGLMLMLGDWQISYTPYSGVNFENYDFLVIPFFKYINPQLGWWYVPFVVLIMICTSNAVNLTDGLDGLAIGVSLANIFAFLIITYLVSRVDFSQYLFLPYIREGGEITVFLAALLGASLGFLWFNSHPAQVFMGDTGSMMLGGVLGATAIFVKQELLIIVIGGIFVLEALSVILQVGMFKLTGTRVLRMSPLHHHFEKKGIHESKIIIRFWIVAWLLAMAGLTMLKLR